MAPLWAFILAVWALISAALGSRCSGGGAEKMA